MKKQLVINALLLVAPLTVQAAGDALVGKEKAFTCRGCHAVPSYTNVYPTYSVPKLGGQHAQYIVTALQAYKDGLRGHKTMQAQARTLSTADMEDIAAYFSQQSAE
jgi:cytochrome c553